MNNKLTIVLNDKDTLMELAKDPEVQIKIKDAILDKIGRRALKIANVTNEALEAAKEEVRKIFFTECGWYTPELKSEWKALISKEAKKEFESMVREELSAMRVEIKQMLKDRKEEIKAQIEVIDVEDIIREVAEKVIREKFK